MRTMRFSAPSPVVATVLAHCGSLMASARSWRRLALALHANDAAGAHTAANDIIDEATPEPGEIHPAPAEVGYSGPDCVLFVTPGGVQVDIRPGAEHCDGLAVAVNFGRDSYYLAERMLGELQVDDPVETDGVIVWAGNARIVVIAEEMRRIEDARKQDAAQAAAFAACPASAGSPHCVEG